MQNEIRTDDLSEGRVEPEPDLTEFQSRIPDSKADGSPSEKPSRQIADRFSLLVAIAVTLCVIGGAAWILFSLNSSTTDSDAGRETAAFETTQTDPAESVELLESLQRSLRDVVAGYFAAETVEERRKFVRNPAVLDVPMKRHYASHPEQLKKLELADLKVVKTMSRKNVLEDRNIYVTLAKLSDGSAEPVVVEERDGVFGVDWETQSRYNPTTVSELLEQRPERPVRLRVYLKPSERFQKPFTPETHFAVELVFPNRTEAIDAYVPWRSEDARYVTKALKQQSLPPVIVDVSVPAGFEGRAVVIDQFVQPNWFVAY